MITIKAMYEEACSIQRGNQLISGMSLICLAPFEQTVQVDKVQRGTVVHLVKDSSTNQPAFRVGLPAVGDTPNNAVPMFIVPRGKDSDTSGGSYEHSMQLYSHPDNPYQKGTFAIVSTGAFELYSTAYDRDVTYDPNTPLTASTTPGKEGLLAPGKYYEDIICGVVSFGKQVHPHVPNKDPNTNPLAPNGLLFYTHFQPRLDKATITTISA